jgi:hypothetical protein
MPAPVPELFGGVMSDNRVAVAPFLDVLREDKHTLTHYFVADQESVGTEIFADKSGFATGRSAEVKYDRRRVHILLKHLLKEHRRSLLNIITSGVEERIQREWRPLGEVVSVEVPWHFVRVTLKSKHVQLGIKPDRSDRLALQSPDQQLSLGA